MPQPNKIHTISTLHSSTNSTLGSAQQKTFPTTAGRRLNDRGISNRTTSSIENSSSNRVVSSVSSSSSEGKKNTSIIGGQQGDNDSKEFTPQKFIPPPRFDRKINNLSKQQHVCSSLCGSLCSSSKSLSCHDTPIFNDKTVSNISDAIILSELNSPIPDVHVLFTHFDNKYFRNKLTTCTTLRWSSKMTLCAGICYSQYQKYTITKTYGPRVSSSGYFDPTDVLKKQEQVSQKICTISLSECLLKFRPPIDTISTLIHEMIHAFLFIDSNVVDRDGHGDNFKWWMTHINSKENGTGIHITIYHTFHAEVDYYRQHHWKCKKCGLLIKRAMNRAPNKHDDFFPDHEKKCGGSFVKIKEPEKTDKKEIKGNYKGIEKSRKFMENFLTKNSPIKGIESNSDLTSTAASQISSAISDKKNGKKPLIGNKMNNNLIIIEEEDQISQSKKRNNNPPVTIEILDDDEEVNSSPSSSSDQIFINDDDYVPPDNVIILTNDQDIENNDIIIL